MAKNATIFQGDEMTLSFTIYSDAAESVAYDLTGATITYRVGDLEKRHTFFEQAGVVTDGPNGACTVTLTEAQTANLAPKNYEHQLIVEDQTGTAVVAVDGTLTINRKLTAPA